MVYLNIHQLLPIERIQQLLLDLIGHSPSEATILAHMGNLHEALAPVEAVIRGQVIQSEVVHADETGMRAQEELQWMHTATNALWTLYGVHGERGYLGMNAMNVLPSTKGSPSTIAGPRISRTCIGFSMRSEVPICCGNAKGSSITTAKLGPEP
jgi:hypothetical protein